MGEPARGNAVRTRADHVSESVSETSSETVSDTSSAGVSETGTRPQERHLRLVHPLEAMGDELRHLRRIEEEGDTGMAALVVVAPVLATLVVVVSIELVVTFAFYLGWI
jgi:hypothetical protein